MRRRKEFGLHKCFNRGYFYSCGLITTCVFRTDAVCEMTSLVVPNDDVEAVGVCHVHGGEVSVSMGFHVFIVDRVLTDRTSVYKAMGGRDVSKRAGEYFVRIRGSEVFLACDFLVGEIIFYGLQGDIVPGNARVFIELMWEGAQGSGRNE